VTRTRRTPSKRTRLVARLAALAVLSPLFVGAVALGAPELALRPLRSASPGVLFSVPTSERVVALTIDDGPSTATGEILRVLREHQARATFFLIGEHLLRSPDGARRIVADGHEVAHHMMTSDPSIRLPRATFLRQFDEMDRLLRELGGVRLFRPGSGWYDADMVRTVESRGYRLALGSVYPFDAQLPFPRFLGSYVLEHAAPGSIIVLHDGPGRGLRTAAVLRRVLPELRARGYRVVSLSELTGRVAAAR
jgi:peptidoglycan/xylan/chitin deacetylase (PgdA/CDA1 family)